MRARHVSLRQHETISITAMRVSGERLYRFGSFALELLCFRG
jgi:hypothetical protein